MVPTIGFICAELSTGQFETVQMIEWLRVHQQHQDELLRAIQQLLALATVTDVEHYNDLRTDDELEAAWQRAIEAAARAVGRVSMVGAQQSLDLQSSEPTMDVRS